MLNLSLALVQSFINLQTVSAKDFRKNLKKYIEKISKNKEEYTLIYRSKPVMRLAPIEKNKKPTLKEINKILDEITGTGLATDITTPDKDNDILRKRLIEKYGRI